MVPSGFAVQCSRVRESTRVPGVVDFFKFKGCKSRAIPAFCQWPPGTARASPPPWAARRGAVPAS
eukprot:3744311-Rhodomonas_salina.3